MSWIIASEADPTALEPETRSHVVTSAQDNERIDKLLAQVVPELSRSYMQDMVVQACVQLNEQLVTKAAKRVRVGDRLVVVLLPTEQAQAYVPETMDLDILFEDAHLLVLNKPAGLVVHPAPGNWRGTLLNGLLARDSGAKNLPRAGIVHRLDKDTSGVMVVAKTRACMEALVRLIAAREVKREYLALTHGCLGAIGSVRILNQAVGRDPRNRLKMAVVDLERSAGKSAVTQVQVLQTDAIHNLSLVHCRLETGRTHQIRVHLSHLGYPLIADALYGGRPEQGLRRQALHARRLAFVHPVTAQALEFLAPVPPDMAAALDTLKMSHLA